MLVYNSAIFLVRISVDWNLLGRIVGRLILHEQDGPWTEG